MKIVTVITQGENISTSDVYVVPTDWSVGEEAIHLGEAMFDNDLVQDAHEYLSNTGKVTVLSENFTE
jgi:hypothetical protein